MRLAGDLLLPPLYVPYINMLAGLANGPRSAHHCFLLLRGNGVAAAGTAFLLLLLLLLFPIALYCSGVINLEGGPIRSLSQYYLTTTGQLSAVYIGLTVTEVNWLCKFSKLHSLFIYLLRFSQPLLYFWSNFQYITRCHCNNQACFDMFTAPALTESLLCSC